MQPLINLVDVQGVVGLWLCRPVLLFQVWHLEGIYSRLLIGFGAGMAYTDCDRSFNRYRVLGMQVQPPVSKSA